MTILKLDYDGIQEEDVAKIYYHRGWLLRKLGLVQLQASSTARGYHVEAEVMADLPPEDIILAQILLGSDIYREVYNFLHHLDGQMVGQWNKLFDKKFIILGTELKEVSREVPNARLTEILKDQITKKVVSI